MAEHNLLGIQGEKIAKEFLLKKDYKIIAANWRFSKAEIDIIAIKDNILIITEVKTRSDKQYGNPEDFVTKAKQKQLIKATNAFIEENNIDLETRFDIIAVTIKGQRNKITHIEDAFYPLINNR